MERKRQRFKSIISLVTMLALCLSLCVTQVFAVTQAEIDEIQRQKYELTALRQQSQQKVDEREPLRLLLQGQLHRCPCYVLLCHQPSG